MTRRTRLSDDELETLFLGTWNSKRKLIAALRLVEEAGYQAGLEARRAAPAETAETRDRQARVAAAAAPAIERFAAACGMTAAELVSDRTHRVRAKRNRLMWVLHNLHGLTHAEAGLACDVSRSVATEGIHGVDRAIAADELLRARLMQFAPAVPAQEQAA